MTPAELLSELTKRGLEAEVLYKEGRSRRLERRGDRLEASVSHERGWAVRAGDRNGSFFRCGVGPPEEGGPWPETAGARLRLPAPHRSTAGSKPSEAEAPLLSEAESSGLLETLAARLGGELAGAVLAEAVLEDGQSSSALVSSPGVAAAWRQRAAFLRLRATVASADAVAEVSLHLAAREARRFTPRPLAARLADVLVARRDGATPERDRADVLLAPAVATRLLAGLLPLFDGRSGEALAARLRDRSGRIASPQLTVVDDGSLAGGVLEAPVDGEGTPTGRQVLVDGGVYLQPLLPWWEQREPGQRRRGCVRRESFRDLPTPAPSHLYVEPDPSCAVGSLLTSVARGYYLLEVDGAGDFDLEAARFSLPVCGFRLESGRARGPISGGELTGSVPALLGGVRAVARDLAFLPLVGMIGSPSLLVSGLELRPRSG